MLSAFIPTEHRYPALPLAGQLVYRRFVQPGPLVLWPAPLKFLPRMVDRDRQLCYFPPAINLQGYQPIEGRCQHFCGTLHVTVQFGLYLYPTDRIVHRDAWRIVSEDPGENRRFPADCPLVFDVEEFPAYSQVYRQQISTVSRRTEPSSRTALMGEQPNPSHLLQREDAMSRHRGAKPGRRCELLDQISLLSPG